MRISCFFLVSLLLIAKVCPADDIYWEDEDLSNEFLEVDDGESSLSRSLQRLKRASFDFFNPFASWTSTTTAAPDDRFGDDNGNGDDNTNIDDTYDKEDEDTDGGSGSPDPEIREKTIHITFVVIQPYSTKYSNRDSPEYRNFSKSLADSVNAVFRDLPGTHRASLVRIQSRTIDEFTCKVTFDIVTNAADTNQIVEVLHSYIKKNRNLGKFAVNDDDFSSSVSDPSAPLISCAPGEIRCPEGRCIPFSFRCDGNQDCSDGSDEESCPIDGTPGGNYDQSEDQGEDNTDDENIIDAPQPGGDDNNIDDGSLTVNDPCSGNYYRCREGQEICSNLVCDSHPDCPQGDDEENCGKATDNNGESNASPNRDGNENATEIPPRGDDDDTDVMTEETPYNENPEQTTRREGGDTTNEVTTDSPPGAPAVTCAPEEIRCPEGSCIPYTSRCNGYRDCSDGSDEDNCFPAGPSGGNDDQSGGRGEDNTVDVVCDANEFRCDQRRCIQDYQQCDGHSDCDDGTDENGCPESCGGDDFRCNDTKCIERYRVCNRIVDCANGEDEYNCPCTPEEFRCVDDGSCIELRKKCDNINHCLDGSDEQECGPQCPADKFTCARNSYVPCGTRCDDIPDCDGGEDEDGCSNEDPDDPTSACNHQCDGNCIDDSKICDDVADCQDGSDERNCYNCVSYDDFRCGDGECINIALKCNGLQDCSDNSDEKNCNTTTSPTTGCNNDQFQCRNGECINQQFQCDGTEDCSDRSDEENCSCAAGYFECTSGQCILQTEWCDGIQQCDDSSDELDCPPNTTPFSSFPYPPVTDFPPDLSTRAPSFGGERGESGYSPDVGIPAFGGDSRDEQKGDRGDPGYPGSGTFGGVSNGGQKGERGSAGSGRSGYLILKSYPEQQTVRYVDVGGDVVFSCRDEGDIRAPVRWVRDNGIPLKPGSTDIDGRLEMFGVTTADSGIYVCQAPGYLGQRGSEIRVTLTVERSMVTSRPSFMSCGANEATCVSGQCIRKSAVCDGRPDCSDGSDEDNCPNASGMCEPNQGKCDNGRCILKTWFCDGDDDCRDGSDETGCNTNRGSNGQCLSTEFACRTQGQCIPKSFQCDGASDCFDKSDEVGCGVKIVIITPPYPANVRLKPGEDLRLKCEAAGVPIPLISWRLNWGHVPEKCVSTSENGIGELFCPNMQIEDRGAYSCEAINHQGSAFAVPDSIVFVTPDENMCPTGYFNNEAQSENECIRCFCFGKSSTCRSADLYTYTMPTLLGDGGTRLLGVQQSYNGDVTVNKQPITNQYYYQPLRNGATVTKLSTTGWSPVTNSQDLPYLSLPETYNGNQLKSYGGHIRYRVEPHNPQGYGRQSEAADIIILGKYQNLLYVNKQSGDTVEARLTAGNWQKSGPRGLTPASREDIMMALDDIKTILLRASSNDAGVNITEFNMESGQFLNSGLGAASLVEECICPEGYEGLSCQKCAAGFEHVSSGPWLGSCVARQECPPGTYGDPRTGADCRPCPCPLTNKENQFARTCAIGPNGNVVCDCMPEYEGEDCSHCALGYYGNPLLPGNTCKPKPSDSCNAVGTSELRPPDECVCKENVQGRYCDQCKSGTFFLSSDFTNGCAQCFCTGVIRDCTVSKLRRTTTTVRFNVPQIVGQVKLYRTDMAGASGVVRYNAPVETDLPLQVTRSGLGYGNAEGIPGIFYFSLPASFAGDKVTAYGGYLNYELSNVAYPGSGKNNAADVQLISMNRLTFHYFGNFAPARGGYLNATIQLLETGWKRSDGKPVSREYFLLALADVQTILVKATFTNNADLASIESASIDTASPTGTGPQALHVEQCVCPEGYVGTSCEDCAPGYTRTSSGLYLEYCGRCSCNGRSNACHPETGECYNCADNYDGPQCEKCASGYYQDEYNNCVLRQAPPTCNCDPRGEDRPCDASGYCYCKQNVEGAYCDRCRNGTFGLNRANPLGCNECYCSGATRDCHEATHYNRLPIPAPILGDDYGGYTLMDINADQVINDQFVPVPGASELKYIFSSPPSEELYWSIPKLPGNRLLSYGGELLLTQKYDTGINIQESSPGVDVIFMGGTNSIYWSNPTPIRTGVSLSYQVPLRETEWYILNTPTRVSRYDFMAVLATLKRVLVRATLSNISELTSTSIADVSMDTAAESYDPLLPAASGVEMCICPEGHSGTSCETCSTGYYRDANGGCRQCKCNGHECSSDNNGQMVCNCRPPYNGPDCSAIEAEVTTTRAPPTQRSTISVKISSPTIKIQEIGSTVSFTCQARSFMTPRRLRVAWRKADGELPLGRTIVDDRTGSIIISNLQISDSGKYICESSDGVSTEQATATLKVPGIEMSLPTVSIYPPIKEYYEGERVELQCSSSGNPAPTISWQRASNRPLPYSHEIYNALLILQYAVVEDSGEYRCIGSNAAGSADATAIITVRPRPSQRPRETLTVSSKSPSVNEGQSLQLVCTASPNVAAGTIDWVRQDGTPFLSNVRSENGVLYVSNAYLDNQGVYICQTSSHDTNPVLVVLTVVPIRTPSPNEASKITLLKERMEIPTGGTDTVECAPEGYPLPRIKWSRNEESFGPGTSQRENTLVITNAQESDRGYYVCEGVVDGNPVVRNYIFVDILRREAPVVEIYPQGESSVLLGTQHDFQCMVTAGIPTPVVTWHRSGSRPLSSHVQILQNNRLSFETTEVNDEGEYTCTAANAAGSSSASATLRVRSFPDITIRPDTFIQAQLGERVAVLCRADGYPEPQVSISTLSDRRLLVPSRPGTAEYLIQRVAESDEADYVCTATSAGGTNEEQFTIRVERGDIGIGTDNEGSGDEPSPPDTDNTIGGSTTIEPGYMIAQEGKDAVITCNASSEYRVQWGREDGQPLQQNAVQDGPVLIIYRASKRDSGKYQCMLIDQLDEVQKAAITSLVVLAAPVIRLRPPTQTVRPGESTTVECVVEGDDILSVFWTPLNPYISSRVETRNSTLIFRQIEVEDAGQYKCTAISRVAEAYATAEVIVSEETDRETSVSHDNEQHAHVGAGVHLSCNMSSGLTIEWRKNGKPLPRSVAQKSDGSLFIRYAQKSDSGYYVCNIRDQYGRQTSNYINLHIEGYYCSEREFHCYDDSRCIEEDQVCDGNDDCMDASDERVCGYSTKKRRSGTPSDPITKVPGAPVVAAPLISINQPRRAFRVGETVEVLCKATSRNIKTTWERYGTNEYVDTRIYGDGALLIIPDIKEHDTGVYRCRGQDPVTSQTSYEDFDLQVTPETSEPSYPSTNEAAETVYTARLGDTVDLPCNHNLNGRTTVEWKREYIPLPPYMRTNERIIHLDRVTEADAGTYICKVSNDVARVMTKATLRVVGVIPRFDGDGYLALPTLKDAFTKFDIEVSFKPIDRNGVILYNGENEDGTGDYLVLQLLEGIPNVIVKFASSEPVVSVNGDRPLQLNTWHTIRLSRSEYKITMDVDNTGPFVGESAKQFSILDLHGRLYIGNLSPQHPQELEQSVGFVGCISMLILGKEEKNIIGESIDQRNVMECDACSPNLCVNSGVCQEARNERGYMCLCAAGFAGANCDRTGEACHPGLCGPGKCKEVQDGYKCLCPVTFTGKNCDVRQNIAYPAFTGTAYLAIKAPATSRSLRMSMKLKAKPPVTDGIIMYCAQSSRGYGGFTSLTVHEGRLEFRYDLGDGNPPIVLVSNKTLQPYEWTDVRIARVGQVVSLRIGMLHSYEDKLASSRELILNTPMFVGGVDDSIVLNNNVGVSGGFSGCIKDVSLLGDQLDLINATIQSANIQECVNNDRGDIPETESICSQCRNNGYCVNPDATACTCTPGFTGLYCETRVPLPNTRPPRDPCAARPCINEGTCKIDRGSRMNYSCDCPLGWSGANCQMPLELLQSVGFNGNGYIELPMEYLRYDQLESEPALVALAFHTNTDGVLLYQTEAGTVVGYGDYIILRVERGNVLVEWDTGSGQNQLIVDEVTVTDGERHEIIFKLFADAHVELSVDRQSKTAVNEGISNIMNADSNIYVGGIPEYMNSYSLTGLVGCIEQVEFNSDRSVNLGRNAVAGRNTQRCKDMRFRG